METVEAAKSAAVEGLPFLVEKVCVAGVGRSGSVALLLTRQPLEVRFPLTCVGELLLGRCRHHWRFTNFSQRQQRDQFRRLHRTISWRQKPGRFFS